MSDCRVSDERFIHLQVQRTAVWLFMVSLSLCPSILGRLSGAIDDLRTIVCQLRRSSRPAADDRLGPSISVFSLLAGDHPWTGTSHHEQYLLNGVGHFPCNDTDKQAKKCVDQPTYYNTTFTAGKKYLLRLINTSIASTYIFSIDNHKIKVVGADFVPIEPYDTDSVLIGIGQRYHVIVEAKPTGDNRSKEKHAYWIRTTVAARCSGFARGVDPDDRTGILHYEGVSKSVIPDTRRGTFNLTCSDEPYDKLKPVVPWKVGRPSNEQETWSEPAACRRIHSLGAG